MHATTIESAVTIVCPTCHGAGCIRCARTGTVSDTHEAWAFARDFARWNIQVDREECHAWLVPVRGKADGMRWTTQEARELVVALTDALNALDQETADAEDRFRG